MDEETTSTLLLEMPCCLSERELEVLKLVATGATNQQIARTLVISPNTVKVHLRNIYEKLGVQSRTEATMEAVRQGWVFVPGGAANTEGESPAEVMPDFEPLPSRIAPWQRVYMLVAALLVVLALVAPDWWRSRSEAGQASPLSDIGAPQMPVPPRSEVTRWVSRAPLPEARSRLAVVTVGNRIYAIGGETANGVTDQVTVYDPIGNGWLERASKPTAVANVAAVEINGLVYIPGGNTADGQLTDVLEIYDPSADSWQTGTSLPVAVAAYAATALDGKLYLFGGWDGTGFSAESYVYDPSTEAWNRLSPMAEPRAFLAAGALDGRIYIVGGFDGSTESDSVVAYDPALEGSAEGPWSVQASLNHPRAGLAVVAKNKRLYVVGGWSSTLTFNEQFDLGTGAWSRIESPVSGEWRNLGLAAYGDYLYAVGGWSGGYMASSEEYRALFRINVPLSSGK